MKIDWSKAPEGATHYAPETEDQYAAWYKEVGGRWMEWIVDGGYTWRLTACLPSDAIARPVEWDGTGLPPVGTKCEVDSRLGAWLECTVVAHFDGRAVIVLGDRESAHIIDAEQIRPIRTTEQIAAEKRELEIADIERVIKAAHYGLVRTDISPAEKAKHYAAALHAAGYRKTEQEKNNEQ